MEGFLAGIVVFIIGFIAGGWRIYSAFEKELKSGRVICSGKVYSAKEIL